MSEKERLIARLAAMGTIGFNVFPGSGPFTEKELCKEINSALDQVENGTATVSDSFDDDAEQIDVRELFRRKQ